MNRNNIPNKLIVIEDCEEDFFIIMRAIKRSGENIDIAHFIDGESAINSIPKLFDEDPHTLPIILIDLNLPGINGHEIIKKLRDLDSFKFTPMIMYSSSTEPNDIIKAYAVGANSFIKKEVNYKEFSENILKLKSYWIDTNIFPIK